MKSHPQSTSATFDQPSVESVAARIRRLRKSRGWSLSDVELRSHGSIKAVVLGSYERNDRNLSVRRAIELATLFEVPVTYLFDEVGLPQRIGALAPMIDLRKVRNESVLKDTQSHSLRSFLGWIASQRQDWNGEIMSLRNSDISILGLMMTLKESEVAAWLRSHHLLIEGLLER